MSEFIYFFILAYFLFLIPRYLQYRNQAYLVVITWSALCSIYELGVGVFWLSKDAMRIDMVMIIILTGLLYIGNFLSYWQRARQEDPAEAAILRQHALYLLPPVLMIIILLAF